MPLSGLYNLWRIGPGPTLYRALKTQVTDDVFIVGFIYAAGILFFSFLVALPGVRGKAMWFYLSRINVAILILTSIMLCNFGQEWEVAELHTVTQYRARMTRDINASVRVKIGLHSVNISLKGDPRVQSFEGGKVNETIDYNERFSWDNEGWTQGRGGFGPFAGRFNQEFRAAQWKGTPYPILWIAEYFTIDGEDIRWGRYYLQAGYFTHIMMWTALPCWFMAVVLFSALIRFGGYFSVLTGLSMISGLILFTTIRNPLQLTIPFEDGFLVFKYGWCYWLCLLTGVTCILIGIVVIFMDLRYPEYLATFFGVDIALDLEELYTYEIKIGSIQRKGRDNSVLITMMSFNGTSEMTRSVSEGDYDSDDYERVESTPQANVQRLFRKRSIHRSLQRSLKNRPRLPPRKKPPASLADENWYENHSARNRSAAGQVNLVFKGDSMVSLPVTSQI